MLDGAEGVVGAVVSDDEKLFSRTDYVIEILRPSEQAVSSLQTARKCILEGRWKGGEIGAGDVAQTSESVVQAGR